MKIKMVKMGMDIDETINHRIRGIVPTNEGKYLFIEISQGYSMERKYISLSKKEYELKFPHKEYIHIDFCFRVDIPEDFYKNYTKEYSKYDRQSLFNYEYTKENIIKVLQKFNKDIDDIEFTNEDYIDKFCEQKGFFELYDDRLKHKYEPTKIEYADLYKGGYTRVKVLYTCYSASGLKYQEEQQQKRKTQDLINEYGKNLISNLMTKYVEELCKKVDNQEIVKSLIQDKNRIFEDDKNIDLTDTKDIDY